MPTPTPEQQKVIDHDVTQHGVVRAGPGTGKSWAAVALLEKLQKTGVEVTVRILTFTRAATAELAKKLGDSELTGLAAAKPSTIHSLALRLLMGNPESSPLPMPLRIPDAWELRNIIRPDLSRKLKMRGFQKVGVVQVQRLEEEMAAGWQALDPEAELLSEIDTELRNSYLGFWRDLRQRLGFSLLAELPLRAVEAIVDYDLEVKGSGLLIVDEYQDLNEIDIKLIRLIADSGYKVLAIGDEDQSIYGKRLAAPEGILRFKQEFDTEHDYPLTVTRRFGGRLLEAANELIESAPRKDPKPRLSAHDAAPDSGYEYLRFPNNETEADGIARIIKARMQAGVEVKDIAILVRSNAERWAGSMKKAFDKHGVPYISTSWVDEVLWNEEVRRALALAHLLVNRFDSLAWWSLLLLRKGVAKTFPTYVLDACQGDETFSQALFRLHPEFPDAPSAQSSNAARTVIDETVAFLDAHPLDELEPGESGWGGWLLQQMKPDELDENATRFFSEVGDLIEEGPLSTFLAQMAPAGRDYAAASADSVRIMTMAGSKGLTINTVIVPGVEAGIVPMEPPKGGTLDEERRLLYVAMTRATDLCIFTFAQRRKGPVARFGKANVMQARGRSDLLRGLPIGEWTTGTSFVKEIEKGSSAST